MLRPMVTDFGRRVKTVLIARGWSQRDLAHYMGVTPQALSQMLRAETGNKLETVEAIARVLAIPPQRLDTSFPRRYARKLEELNRQKRKTKAMQERSARK